MTNQFLILPYDIIKYLLDVIEDGHAPTLLCLDRHLNEFAARWFKEAFGITVGDGRGYARLYKDTDLYMNNALFGYRAAIDRFIINKHGKKSLTIPPTKNKFLRRLVHEYSESRNLVHIAKLSHTKRSSVCPNCDGRNFVREYDDREDILYSCCSVCPRNGRWPIWMVEGSLIEYKSIVITMKKKDPLPK
jgi:hypothetical protein